MQFVSSDKQVAKYASLFLQNDQIFVPGGKLKDDLNKINEYYSRLPQDVREMGIDHFASSPPKDGEFYVTELWDKNFTNWRDPKDVNFMTNEQEILKKVKFSLDAPPTSDIVDPEKITSLTSLRRVKKIKGNWYQLSKNITNK